MNDDLESHRGELFALAYRMLGSAADAEDVVQETFVRYAGATAARTPRAYLRTIATRVCLDRLKSARHRHESVGERVPEPVADDDTEGSALLAESLQLAFVRLLQSLSPLERAVFLLREVFELEYAEIAAVVDRTEPACRQLARRARDHVAEGRPRYEATPDRVRAVVERFAEAARRADARGLLPLLAPGVRLIADGGDARYGKARALPKPLVGAEGVARFLAAVQKQAPRGLTTRVERVNGSPALLSYLAGALTAVLWFRVLDDRIEEIILVSDPERLAHVRARWPHASAE